MASSPSKLGRTAIWAISIVPWRGPGVCDPPPRFGVMKVTVEGPDTLLRETVHFPATTRAGMRASGPNQGARAYAKTGLHAGYMGRSTGNGAQPIGPGGRRAASTGSFCCHSSSS